MIDIASLGKRYGQTLALSGVTLSVQSGEIVGLLGPNGAGKTTMMRILTGYFPPTEGQARVAGFDVVEQSLEVRSRIGYLPEGNPLYEELAVLESLEWSARLRGLAGPAARQAISRSVESCGLTSVLGQDIGTLSKGYRQRVGLAQAILHDPEILILDEPTSGLDPNQQQEVRELIRQLRQKKTVLLSTHVLPEAQSACDRVLIIHRGRIVADGTPDDLTRRRSGSAQLRVELKGPPKDVEGALASLPGVQAVAQDRMLASHASWLIDAGTDDIRESVFELAAQKRWPILEMTLEKASLEDVFRELTQ